MIKGNCWIFGWHSVTPQRLECKEKHSLLIWSLLLALSRKFNIFKQVIQNELSHYPRHLGKIKARRFKIYSTYWKVDYQHCRTVWRLSFRKQLLLFPQNPFWWQTLPNSQLKQKNTCTCVHRRWSGNFYRCRRSAGHLCLYL